MAFSHRFGLLEDLLEHVVRIAAELDVVGLDVERRARVCAHVALVAMDDVAASRP